ncbi:hypothetical protein HHL28_07590 [Aerophototrophica crusticola]|uniref:DUF4747 domain-containing protein n=1 Tax=Aerophototrophica crusticola TaxID=1709002 RepID=A0A858R7F7_9PROT|nr:hypothetical protein HHL28_07590 [Rhodospirillaceae bacterium B3]
MREFHLYRFQIFPTQTDMFDKTPRPQDILREMVESKPERQLKTKTWLIGNYESLFDSMCFFKFGKKSHIKVPKYKDGVFSEYDDEATPFTEIFLDYETEVCAIARKSRVAESANGIARQLTAVLLLSPVVEKFGVQFYLEPMRDPQGLIERLSQNVEIHKFYFTVRKPNIIDMSDFTNPLKHLTKAMRGDTTTAVVDGVGLKNDFAVGLTREAAASGQDAGAVYREVGSKRKHKKSLSKNPVLVRATEEEVAEQKHQIARRINKAYEDTRYGSKNGR